ncbi:hypothetical protein [Amycolatopsis sp. SID8362]|uniref:hypothetical protein n=1 Tax=Amycolatopsis sp. SID8362 TaxID=2690346 RepID=UPI0013713F9E|nr:hypothetical protein [Amycolatopsis sp. SID8362]NBH04081.1 hypothetical protein [Amycolatopsis sp. SID8362]NED40781.1 hypothetical protein [Amycolatopsis sp. SID8362]
MTDHLTRHDTDRDDDLGRDDRSRDGTAEVPEQEQAEFREPGTGQDRGLSTADLASAGSDTASTGTAPAESGGDVETPPLIDEEKVTGFRDRWQNVQTGFVDDPKQAVREADELVAAVISALATTFAEHKSDLEGQWQQGEPATEELRIALRRYRSFFDQLLPR